MASFVQVFLAEVESMGLCAGDILLAQYRWHLVSFMWLRYLW